jgi:hypothetical protein
MNVAGLFNNWLGSKDMVSPLARLARQDLAVTIRFWLKPDDSGY